jgi:quinol monooxygenase YgiN
MRIQPECTIIGIVRAQPARRDELREILHGFIAPTRREPGCINYELHVSDDDPNLFMFYENWRTRKDLADHLAMPHLSVLSERKHDLLAADIEIRYFTMLSPLVPTSDQDPP